MRFTKLLLLLAICLSAAAQTYTPKQIRLQGAEGLDQAELLRLINLKAGAPLTKTDIEAAMQRLADTGAFADLSYTVDGNTLTFILKRSSDSQELPVRFSNFVWWQPGELEPLVEARVPLFKGKLPLTGKLTGQVVAALVALLAEKGIPDAKITVADSTLGSHGNGIAAIALTLSEPAVILGEVKVQGAAPIVQEQLDVVTSRLAAREFDSAETSSTIHDNVLDTHLNGGYLDATVDPPIFSPPHQDMLSYEVDATVTVHPGELYHIASLDLKPPPPLTQTEADRAAGLRVGDAAGVMRLRIASESLAREYGNHGHLEAHVQAVANRNAANHTVEYRFSIDPGALDHLAAVDTTALSPEMRQQFESVWLGKPGMEAGLEFNSDLTRALRAMNAMKTVHITERLNRKDHTVTLVLLPSAAN